jgi:hypothetical protein
MISRSEPMSAANAAELFRSAVSGKRMSDVLDRIMGCAEGRDAGVNALDEKVREKLLLEYRQLVLSYGIGRARAQGLVCYRLDLGDLSTLDGCKAALQAIAEHQHYMTTEQAADLRATVVAAAGIIRSQAGEALLDSLEEHEGEIVFARAGATKAEILDQIGRQLDARNNVLPD